MLVDPQERMADLVALSRWYQLHLDCPPLIPLNGKVPAKPGWPDGPRKDPKLWEAYLRDWPGNVGMVGGLWPCGLYGNALDIDRRKHPEAEESWAELTRLGFPRLTVTTLTSEALAKPSEHLWFLTREELGTGSLAEFPGIDLRGAGGQWVVPYSLHPETLERYAFEWGYAPDDRQLVVVESEPVLAVLRTVGRAGNVVTRQLSAEDEEAVNLLLALGGHSPVERKGYIEVTRPGKERSAGTSAIVGYLGPGVVKVWTPNWPGLPAGVYDLRQLRALAGRASTGDRILAALATDRPEVPQLPILPPLRTRSLAEIQPRAQRWLWQARIPAGAITIMEGDPGLGKSTIAMDIAARVSRGGMFPDNTAAPQGMVLVLTAEDSVEEVVAPRLLAAGADPAFVKFVDGRPYYRGTEEELELVMLPQHLEQLRATILETGALLVVADVLASYTGLRSSDLYKDSVVRSELMAPVKNVAERTGASFLALRHLPKSMGRNARVAGSGSIALGAAARSVLLVAEHPEEEALLVLSHSKANGTPLAESLAFRLVDTPGLQGGSRAASVQWCGSVALSSDQLLGAASEARREDPEERTLVEDLADLLGVLLTGQERTLEEVQGIVRAGQWDGKPPSKSTFDRARKAAGVEPFQTWDPEASRPVHWLRIPPPSVAEAQPQGPPESVGPGALPLPSSEGMEPPSGKSLPPYHGYGAVSTPDVASVENVTTESEE